MKNAKDLKRFQAEMKHRKTKHEQLFYEWYSAIYSKEDFKNQCILGPYILDFVIVPKILVVEIDGLDHENKRAYDEMRDVFIRKCGLVVYHVTHSMVENEFDTVKATISLMDDVPDAHTRFRSALGLANAYKSKILKELKDKSSEN